MRTICSRAGVDWMIRRGADDFDVAHALRPARPDAAGACRFEAAMSRVEFWYRAERKAHQIACAFGRGHAAALIPLQSIRLLLRLPAPASACMPNGRRWSMPWRRRASI